MSDRQLVEYTESEKLWRCPECGDEKPFGTFQRASQPRWCLGECGSHQAVPTPMSLVERERIYPSVAAWRLLTAIEVSDWGLLAQAVEHYKRNRRSAARRNPAVDAVLARGVYPRFDAMLRAFADLQRASPGDTEHGGRVVRAWPERGADDSDGTEDTEFPGCVW